MNPKNTNSQTDANVQNPKLDTFTQEELKTSSNKKIAAVVSMLNDTALIERVNSYSERYWDQKWSDRWAS